MLEYLQENLAGILTAILTSILLGFTGVAGTIAQRRGAKRSTGRFVVRYPVWVFVLGLICMTLFLGLFVAGTLEGSQQEDYAFIASVSLIFFALGLYLAWLGARWQVSVGRDIEVTPVIGSMRIISFDEIDHAELHGTKLHVLGPSGTKLFRVETVCRGIPQLMERLKQEHKYIL